MNKFALAFLVAMLISSPALASDLCGAGNDEAEYVESNSARFTLEDRLTTDDAVYARFISVVTDNFGAIPWENDAVLVFKPRPGTKAARGALSFAFVKDGCHVGNIALPPSLVTEIFGEKI